MIDNQQKVTPHCKKYSAHTLIHTIINTMHFISSTEYVVIKNDQFYFSIQVYKKKRGKVVTVTYKLCFLTFDLKHNIKEKLILRL